MCPHCGKPVSAKKLWCPHCARRVRYMNAWEAIFGGFGVIDLIPGVRDLPFLVRLALTLCAVSGMVALMILNARN